jgi:hypothetical protein
LADYGPDFISNLVWAACSQANLPSAKLSDGTQIGLNMFFGIPVLFVPAAYQFFLYLQANPTTLESKERLKNCWVRALITTLSIPGFMGGWFIGAGVLIWLNALKVARRAVALAKDGVSTGILTTVTAVKGRFNLNSPICPILQKTIKNHYK